MSTYLRQWFMERCKYFLEPRKARKTRKKDFGWMFSRFDINLLHAAGGMPGQFKGVMG